MKYVTCPYCGAEGVINMNNAQTFSYSYTKGGPGKKVSCHKCLNPIGTLTQHWS